MKPNRLCKECDTYYRDPGGKVGDPKRYCPKCGSWAWYWVDDRVVTDRNTPNTTGDAVTLSSNEGG